MAMALELRDSAPLCHAFDGYSERFVYRPERCPRLIWANITMVLNRFSVLVSGFGVGFGLVHTSLVVVSGRFGMFQDVSGSKGG
jgi:hypothetical protein